ncbi:MAG: hypothetical protein J6A55_01460 [Oscillospiraceae bacterium]|nr:hypothetical protein [Oscillospiraceae bacterium]
MISSSVRFFCIKTEEMNSYSKAVFDFSPRFLLERRKTWQRRTCFGFNTFGVLKIRNDINLPRNSLNVFVGVPF